MTMGISCETPSKGSVGNQHAAHRLDRQLDSGQRTRLCAAHAPAALTTTGVLTGPRVVSTPLMPEPSRWMAVTSVERHSVAPCSHARSREADHHAVGIDEAVGGAEAAAQNVVGAQLRNRGDDVVARDHARLRQSQRFLQRLVGLQIVEVRLLGGDEQVALVAIAGGLSQALVERGVERNRVQRHLDVGLGSELRAHAAHALAGGPFALVRFALHDEHVAATGFRQMPRDARADDSAADNDYFRRLHFSWPQPPEHCILRDESAAVIQARCACP